MTDRPVADREPLSAEGDLLRIAARMVRLEAGCEKGHRAGQWHMHEEPFHAIGRALAADVRSLDATRAHPDEAGLVLVRAGTGGVLPDGTTNHPPIDFDAAQPAVPVAGAEVWIELRNRIDAAIHAHCEQRYRAPHLVGQHGQSYHAPEAEKIIDWLRAVQPEDDGLARSGVDAVGELRRIERRLSDIYRVVAHNASNEAVLTREAVALGMEAAAVHHPGREE